MKKEKVMDWTTFIGTVAVLLFAVIPMMAFPKASEDIITGINSAISDSIGSIYLFMGLAIFCFVMISHLVNMVMSHLVKQVINQNLIHLHGRQCCFVQA
ncbi:hypothetical protein T9H88_03120 [Staphylococcus aureus]|nr:hypothetical protein T9H88_03120 [Staphylococcus aureus]